jgi:20S proteasome alpha/beta subunit
MLKQYLFRWVSRIVSPDSSAIDHLAELFRYQGHVGAYLVLGGVDSTGAHLFTVHAHGSTDKLPYVTMGSGSLAAMAVFESAFKQNMKVSYRPRKRSMRLEGDM